MVKVCCISDTHAREKDLQMPEADLLIHAGDITHRGELSLIREFNKWLKDLPYTEKIVIPGNHDKCFQKDTKAKELLTNCTLLIDSCTTFRGLKIYGSPWTPKFGTGWAFNASRGSSIRGIWNKIPEDTDILITHGPPFKILDSAPSSFEGAGCEDLSKVVKVVKPWAHIFGHLHANHGRKCLEGLRTLFVNASICNEAYEPVNSPIVIEV